MRLFSRLSSVAAPARMRAQTDPDPGGWRDPSSGWMFGSSLGGYAGGSDAALALSYVYCAVDTISADFGTSTLQVFENLGEDGRRRVQYSDLGIGGLARKLRWSPNNFQTAKAFWSTLAWQYLLRPAAYAELVWLPGGPNGFMDQLIPRHPDRVKEVRLPSGRIQYELRESNGSTRIVLSDEMFVVRNTSMDGLRGLSRMEYGREALTSALELQKFTTNYFKKGVTASLLATYKGDLEDEDERQLHGSITRYMSGVENAGGLMLVPEDVDVKPLGVSAHDAELLGLKNISGRDVARMFKMPPSWLGIEGAASYGSQIQDSANYQNRVQIPLAVEFEQAIQRDLIIAADRYFAKFNLDYLTRGSLLERMQSYEIGIRARVIRPSEARVREDMSPDESLDKLSESDFQPGKSGGTGGQPQQDKQPAGSSSARAQLKGTLALHDTAVRVLRREKHHVEALAKKHASDVEGWQAGLREFYGGDHAGFLAREMRLDMETARAVCAQHGSQLEAQGIVIFSEHFERQEAEELCALALAGEQAAA